MDQEKRRNIVEAIGLVAIVASLVFVAWELHEVNVASRIAARDSITAGHLEFMAALVDDETLPKAIWKLHAGMSDELDEFEIFQIDIHHQRRWRHYERTYYLFQLGVLDEQEWNGFRATMLVSMNEDHPFSSTSRETFEGMRSILSEEFVAYVDSLVEE